MRRSWRDWAIDVTLLVLALIGCIAMLSAVVR